MNYLSFFRCLLFKKKIVYSGGNNYAHIETDFTTQMLYASIKTGLSVTLSDFSLHVLFDLLSYSAEIDSQVLSAADGKSKQYSKPMTLADMTMAGKVKG